MATQKIIPNKEVNNTASTIQKQNDFGGGSNTDFERDNKVTISDGSDKPPVHMNRKR